MGKAVWPIIGLIVASLLVACNNAAPNPAPDAAATPTIPATFDVEPPADTSEMTIVRLESDPPGALVLLREADGERFLVVGIGNFEAQAIAMKMQRVAFFRPLTHDLLNSMITHLGGEVVRVVITELRAETFFGRVDVRRNGEIVEVDSRPSDAMALALRAGVPIFASESVLRDAGFVPDQLDERPGQVAISR